ncbi:MULTISPECIES: NifU N-terminal domain-containing protein [Allobacillus]|uniref:NifU N-terminal domain-containing protein n=1 Tax=Allobacillus halotolerans TaxID=570278 RepID=A0ABS6GSZ7_9BACI|nr:MULTISPECIES: NifU N-terminal domain-containing protein [Allobacillus]MBU6081789.1 NifU N-terminal domain-containing protein [Allobacillus halotolerans]TSJ62468.1 scaffolding protein [Allobacillus sp. SKP2-8]
MAVIVESTPNPNAMKFTVDKMIFEGDDSISVMPGETSEYDIMNDLMHLSGVDNVFGYQNFITINKRIDAEWDELVKEVERVIENYGY